MAHPAEPAPKPVFAHARLTPDEADRLASMFRPSWELDDAPFTGAGTMSEADLRALQPGGGVWAEVRATALQAPAVHPGPAATSRSEAHAVAAPAPPVRVEPSVIIAETPPPPVPLQVAARPQGTIMGMQAPTAMPPVSDVPAPPISEVPRIPPSRPSQRPSAPSFVIGPPTPRPRPVVARPAVSVSPDLESYPKKSRTGLFAAIGGVAVLVLGLGIWALRAGDDDKTRDTAPTATAAHPPDDKLSAVPPPPAAPAQAAPPATTAGAAITTAPVAAVPVTPAAHAAAAPPPPRAYGGGAPAAPARPAGKKSGQTIVRDVPF